MIYTIDLSNYTAAYRAAVKPKFKLNAFRRLQAFPICTTEKLLDNYLRENHQITLKYACYLIILNCNIDEQEEELIITLTDKKLEKLARLITYGTGKVSGSRILPFALNKL
jgi:hypothetical protein